MKIVVNTPAGNIGRAVTNQLLNAGKEVVIISRHPEKVADLVARGATLVVGSIDDPAVLDRAFPGATALLWLTPFAFDQPDYLRWARQTGLVASAAARTHGISQVVLISSVGAQHETGVGPIACTSAIERAFAEAISCVASLRAGSFMENFFMNISTIARDGVIYSPHPTTKKIPMVASRDIAAKAFALLVGERRDGFSIHGVHGPVDLSYSDAAAIIGRAIGRPVKHIEVTIEQAKQGMIDAGLPSFAVELLADMYNGLRAGRMQPAELRTPETTTPTTLLEFSSQVLKPSVEATLLASLAHVG